jgi:hypothetical protein
MSSYLFYFLTDENHIVNHLVYEGDDDLGAVNEARSRANGRVIDIWQDDRRVGMVKKGCAPLLFSDPRAV